MQTSVARGQTGKITVLELGTRGCVAGAIGRLVGSEIDIMSFLRGPKPANPPCDPEGNIRVRLMDCGSDGLEPGDEEAWSRAAAVAVKENPIPPLVVIADGVAGPDTWLENEEVLNSQWGGITWPCLSVR
mgnify:CR=1 FL=1